MDISFQSRRRPRWGRWLLVAAHRFGLVLVSLAMLMFGFAGWQLWGTGLQTAAAQNELETEFSRTFGEIGSARMDGLGGQEGVLDADDGVSVPASDDPPSQVAEVVENEPRPTADSGWFDVSQGDAVARIEIPSIGVDSIVVGGVRRDDLERGPGHHPASVLPGQVGNSVIAAHRTSYGAPFEALDRLNAGDQVIVTIPTGHRYVYEVVSNEVIEPDRSDIALAPSAEPVLTLLTCTPKYTSKQRLLVHTTLVSEVSDQVFAPPSDPVAQYSDVVVATDAVDALDSDAGDGAVVEADVVDLVTGETVTVDVPAGVDIDEVSVVDGEVLFPAPVPADLTDGFESGWFEDSAAWGPLWRWGLLCAMVALAAWALISRPLERRLGPARRHQFAANAVGFAVGFGPFVWSLYFFYAAVSRLLPGSI